MSENRDENEFTLESLRGRRVVLDTQGALIYIGRLAMLDERGYWLVDADVHDRNDGHSNKEFYISQAQALEKAGTRNVNRRRVFVERHAIVSISAMDDVLGENAPADDANWQP